MMRRIFISLMLGAAIAAPLEAGMLDGIYSWWNNTPTEPPKIKVLVTHDLPGVVLEVKGRYQIFDPYAKKYISTRFIGKRKFVQPTQDGLKWGEEFPGIFQIKIVPENDKTSVLVDGIEYKGNVYVYDIGGSISVVNEIDVEEYLESVLEPQFDKNLPQETLAAIAITARSQAYYLVKNAKNSFWDVDAVQVGYDGYGVTKQQTPIEEAIRATRYMVLGPKGKKEMLSYSPAWGSDTGGKIGKVPTQFAKITLFEAEDRAKKGDHAAKILAEAFPDTIITMPYKPR